MQHSRDVQTPAPRIAAPLWGPSYGADEIEKVLSARNDVRGSGLPFVPGTGGGGRGAAGQRADHGLVPGSSGVWSSRARVAQHSG